MGEFTDIQWADSTLNLEMGCDGCELWNPKQHVKSCYAGVITERMVKHGPVKGWPTAFETPTPFPERIKLLRHWKDLTGTARPDKPWLNGLPRIIFWNDMGDSFTESLSIDWMAPCLPAIAASPHLNLWLTKRPQRMAEFFSRYKCPLNLWPGTSITGHSTLRRLDQLLRINSPNIWVSYEPVWEFVDMTDYLGDDPGNASVGVQPRQGIKLVIMGGGSGPDALPFHLKMARDIRDTCKVTNTAFFLKQLGSKPFSIPDRISFRGNQMEKPNGFYRFINDRKGGDWDEWPEDLRIRELPKVTV